MAYALVDIGNTSIKVMIYHHSTVSCVCHIGRDPHSLRIFFNTMANAMRFVLISSVVPSINEMINEFKNPRVIFLNHSHFDSILVNHIQPNHSVGIDRLVNAVAVYYKWNTSAVVIDVGTCITCCYIEEKGHYLGGSIMPGFDMIRNAYALGAEQLPLIPPPTQPPPVVGRTTQLAMASGLFFGAIHMINGTISMIKQSNPNTMIILTGGVPSSFFSFLHHDTFQATLQFDGLDIMRKRLALTDH